MSIIRRHIGPEKRRSMMSSCGTIAKGWRASAMLALATPRAHFAWYGHGGGKRLEEI